MDPESVEESTPSVASSARARDLGLTTRQIEVACLLADGLTYAQIAARLSLSQHTVHEHVRHIYERLGGRRSRLIATLVRTGLCDSPPK